MSDLSTLEKFNEMVEYLKEYSNTHKNGMYSTPLIREKYWEFLREIYKEIDYYKRSKALGLEHLHVNRPMIDKTDESIINSIYEKYQENIKEEKEMFELMFKHMKLKKELFTDEDRKLVLEHGESILKETTCPKCGKVASYRLYPHENSDGKTVIGIMGGCCIRVIT